MAAAMDKRTRFNRRGGVWRVNGPAEVCKVGAFVQVAKADGSATTVKILTVAGANPGYVDCAFEAQDKPQAKPAGRRVRRSNGRCRASGCGAAATRGGYCDSCFFDEYDY